jgi:hypothetical protein
MKLGIAIVLVFGIAEYLDPVARAEFVTIHITAEVDHVGDPYNFLGGAIAVGDMISGTYTYDTATPDTSASARIGNYGHYLAPAGLALSVGGIQFTTEATSVDFWVCIVNDYPPVDDYGFISYSNVALPSLDVSVGAIYWTLEDSRGSALSTDSLLGAAPSLGDWDFNLLHIGGPVRGASFGITGHVTSAAAVPEPATILLFLTGGVLLRKRE